MHLVSGNRRVSASRLSELLLLALILGLAGAVRLDRLDRFIASDELRWTCRSINFHTALEERDWASTFQVGHPGVVTMWLGSAGLPLEQVGEWRELCRATDGGKDLSMLDDVGMEGVLQTMAPLLFAARRGVAVGSLLLLALIYVLMRWGIGLKAVPALSGLAVLSLDPFLVAHSRVLHLDAMVSLLCVASVVSLAANRRGTGPSAAISGMLAGLAVLAKVSAATLGPAVAVWYAAWLRRSGGWSIALRSVLVWAVAAGVVCFCIWPAMWADPMGTLQGVLAKAVAEGGVPHASGNYFLGRPVADPGPLFYPVAAVFRLSPWGLLGLAAGLALVMRGKWSGRDCAEPEEPEGSRASLVIALLFSWAFWFALVLTFGPKKFDRYELPSLVALNLAGGVAVGWWALAIARRYDKRRWAGWVGVLAVVAVAGLQLVEARRWHPYQLTYYNPLLGGAEKAEQVLLVGWGEGYDLAADWLNAKPDANELEASARGVSNFAPLFVGRTRSAPGYRPGTTDYVVLYSNQVQRRRNEELLELYYDREAIEPEYVGEVAGIPLVWVYANETFPELRDYLATAASPSDVLVVGGDTVFAKRYDGPQQVIEFWGHWGEAEMAEALSKGMPAGWERVWAVRFPEHDPEAPLAALDAMSRRAFSTELADGQIEITSFERNAP